MSRNKTDSKASSLKFHLPRKSSLADILEGPSLGRRAYATIVEIHLSAGLRNFVRFRPTYVDKKSRECIVPALTLFHRHSCVQSPEAIYNASIKPMMSISFDIVSRPKNTNQTLGSF